MKFDALISLGWQPSFHQQISREEELECQCARIGAHHGSQILLLAPDDQPDNPNAVREFSLPIQIFSSVISTNGNIAVGDWIVIDASTGRPTRRLDRSTVLSRKSAGSSAETQLIVANVNTLIVVSSCNEELNLSRLERYLAIACESGAFPIVVLTKSDQCDDVAKLRQKVESLRPGLLVETMDARDVEQVRPLEHWCRAGQTVALLGSSGVGKSTLANSLGARLSDGREIQTGRIRESDAKGRHTTTSRSIHRLTNGGLLIDNPGIRELQLQQCADGVADVFDDVLQFIAECRFRNCNHKSDIGCAAQLAVQTGQLERRRLVNYLKLLAEQERNSQSLAERRRNDRQQGKLYKSIQSKNRKNKHL